MVATASIKMDELLASWLGSETIYENVMRIIESQKESARAGGGSGSPSNKDDNNATTPDNANGNGGVDGAAGRPPRSPHMTTTSNTTSKKRIEIPQFYRKATPTPTTTSNNANVGGGNDEAVDNPQNPPPPPPKRRLSSSFTDDQTWDGIYMSNREGGGGELLKEDKTQQYEFDRDSIATDGSLGGSVGGVGGTNSNSSKPCIAIQAKEFFNELGVTPSQHQKFMEQQQQQQQQQQQEGNSSQQQSSLPPQSYAQVPNILSHYLRTPTDVYHTSEEDCKYVPIERFERITKELCNLPTFFHKPLYERILRLWDVHLVNLASSTSSSSAGGGGGGANNNNNNNNKLPSCPVITHGIFHHYWTTEMAPYDMNERFFRLLKQPTVEYISRDDFFPYIKELLSDHPGLEFLSNHAEFQDKYAVTVITRIFYSVNLCHSGRITSRQIRKSNLLSVFQQVDEEEDINKVTKYFSYEHFYVLYCRFWELDHDRDYKITREDLLKYGEHSLSHMIVDRIFDAAPRPFEGNDNANTNSGGGGGSSGNNAAAQPTVDENGNVVRKSTRDYLTYEDFIFFMLSEEDKANEFSVRYWFTCVDVDGDDKLNNMEMRSFYAVQLHRMQCMGHEVVPFEDMLCQMMDMIKPANTEHLVVEDFLQPHCSQVSGALFDALFNVNKYVMFEQRDPFLERQKREDEFDTDWDRFACIDYNRLAMEEEQREEEAMEVDWVTMDEEEEDGDEYNSMGISGSSEAPF